MLVAFVLILVLRMVASPDLRREHS
jgi:hypothetical protein